MTETSTNIQLPQAASYFPIDKGLYDVSPALKDFGIDLENGAADQQVFQFDESFLHYREVKLKARKERLSKYYRTQMLSSDVLTGILRFIIERLTLEHSDLFQLLSESEKDIALHCVLTAETLVFDQKLRFLRVERDTAAPVPDYHDTLDALACQVQEDLVIISKSPFGRDWLAAVHLCHANNWAAEEKIGLSFQAVHEPVAGMQNSKRDAEAIVNTIIKKGPYLRFAWGLTPANDLNQHPRHCITPNDSKKEKVCFDSKYPSLFLRVERQILWPFPEQQAALFTIRTYLSDCQEIRDNRHQNEQLVSALNSMSKEQLKYKCLNKNRKPIVKWLKSKFVVTHESSILKSAIHHLYKK